jgi:hypothetical protein
MSFSINSLTRANAQVNQMQSALEMRNQRGSSPQQILQNSVGSSQFQPATYNAQGNMSRSEFNNRLVANSLDRLNQNTSPGKASDAYTQSYQFNKEVLGAFTNIIA